MSVIPWAYSTTFTVFFLKENKCIFRFNIFLDEMFLCVLKFTVIAYKACHTKPCVASMHQRYDIYRNWRKSIANKTVDLGTEN